MSAKAPAKGHTAKHVTAKKHHRAKAKHHPSKAKQPATAHAAGAKVHTVAGHPSHPKPRGFAVAEWAPVCALEAVAMSLRLAGQRVSDDDVVALWEAAGSPADGVTVPAALAAFGLSAPPEGIILGLDAPGPHAVLATAAGWWSWGELCAPWAACVEEAAA